MFKLFCLTIILLKISSVSASGLDEEFIQSCMDSEFGIPVSGCAQGFRDVSLAPDPTSALIHDQAQALYDTVVKSKLDDAEQRVKNGEAKKAHKIYKEVGNNPQTSVNDKLYCARSLGGIAAIKIYMGIGKDSKVDIHRRLNIAGILMRFNDDTIKEAAKKAARAIYTAIGKDPSISWDDRLNAAGKLKTDFSIEYCCCFVWYDNVREAHKIYKDALNDSTAMSAQKARAFSGLNSDSSDRDEG